MTATSDTTGAALSWSRLEADGGFERLAPEAATRVRAIPSLYAERSWSAATRVAGGRRGLAVLFEGGAVSTDVVRALAAELDRPALVADVSMWRRAGRAEALRALARLWAAGEPSGAVILLEHCEALLRAGAALPGTLEAGSSLPGTPGFTARDAREVVKRGQAHPGVVVFATAEAVPADLRGRFDVVVAGEEPGGARLPDPRAARPRVPAAEKSGVAAPAASATRTAVQPGAAAAAEPAALGAAQPAAPTAEPAASRTAVPVASAAAGAGAPVAAEATTPAGAEPWVSLALGAPSSPSRAPEPRPVRWRRSRRALRVVLMLVTGAATAVALGLSAAPRTAPGVPLHFNQTATQRPLRMTYPTAWHRVAAPVLHRLTLGDAIALSSLQGPAGRLVVGITHPATGSPLPADFLSATLPGSPAPELVHLGPHRFARVLDPRLSLHSASSSIYALAAGPRAVVGVCQTASQSFVVACERALGTLQIAAPPPDPRRAYARSLNRVLRALDHARAVHGRALAQASTAVAQAAAADDLASDDGHSAASVARLAAGKAAAENAGLAGALRRGAAAYAALALAVEQGDTVSYARAQAAVSAANAAAESALHALTRLGYQVG